MTGSQAVTGFVWIVSLILIWFGGWVIYSEYDYFKVHNVTVHELSRLQNPDGNYRITDGFVDLANVLKLDQYDAAVVPVRSHSDSHAPVSILMMLSQEELHSLKSNAELSGEAFAWPIESDKPKLAYATHVTGFSFGVRKPNSKSGWDILFGLGPILLGVSFILMNAGIGSRTVGSFLRRKSR